jgi:N,N'-diacetyllegionaminate synthase
MSYRHTLVIAEAGVNHNGNLDLARQLVDIATDAGADLVKFQTFNADRLATLDAHKAAYQADATGAGETQHAMLKRLELSEEDHIALIAHCRVRGIGFFSTGFDIDCVDLLVRLGADRFKVPSGEITNLPYLRHVGAFGRPVILSTGMATLGEIEAAIDVLQAAGTVRSQITVLHCTTDYPTPAEHVNLRAMQHISQALGVAVGYSDHTNGIEVAIAAVALGATVIEKHFTLDRKLPGPDHQASLEASELKAMVAGIRNIERAIGDGIKRPTAREMANRIVARKSLVAARAIAAGDLFSSDNLVAKRPGTGVSPMRWDEFIGRPARRDFAPDEQVEL